MWLIPRVTLFNYHGTLVFGGSRVRAVSDVVERWRSSRPLAERRRGGSNAKRAGVSPSSPRFLPLKLCHTCIRYCGPITCAHYASLDPTTRLVSPGACGQLYDASSLITGSQIVIRLQASAPGLLPVIRGCLIVPLPPSPSSPLHA